MASSSFSTLSQFNPSQSKDDDILSTSNSLASESSQNTGPSKLKSNSITGLTGIQQLKLLSCLGEGAFGKVYKVQYNQQIYALKVYHKANILRLNKKQQVMTEKTILSTLSHPNILKLRYSFQDEKRLYLVTDYARHGSLLNLLKRSVKFNFDLAQYYIGSLINSLENLYQNQIIHRDLKPDNILVDENWRILVGDFGSAMYECNLKEGCEDDLEGTAEYLAPEIIDSRAYSYASDLWSVGCILYQFISGKSPYSGKSCDDVFTNINSHNISFPKDFEKRAKNLCESLLNFDRRKRLGVIEVNGKIWIDFEQIKNHCFFEGIDFENLNEIVPPLDYDCIEIIHEDYQSKAHIPEIFQNERLKNIIMENSHLNSEEELLKAFLDIELVKVKRGLFQYKDKIMALTPTKQLLLFYINSNIPPVRMDLTKAVRLLTKSSNELVLTILKKKIMIKTRNSEIGKKWIDHLSGLINYKIE